MSGPAVSALSHDSVVESHIFDILSGLKGVLSNLDHVTLAHGILAVVDAEVDLDEEMGNLHENDDIPELQDMLDKDYSDNKLNWSSNDEDHERKSPEEQQGHCNVPSDSGTMDVDVNEINKNPDRTMKPKNEVQSGYSHAEKERAAMLWRYQQVSLTDLCGNPIASFQVSKYMSNLKRQKVEDGERPTSSHAITAKMIQQMWDANRQDIKPFYLHEFSEELAYLCPVHAYARWKEASNIKKGMLCHKIHNDGCIEHDEMEAMTSQAFIAVFYQNLADINWCLVISKMDT
uniref:Uncharacterized protein n=1 Tax=Moniliophthora roreri TaxID=221103 RepID=A0A0W0FYC8_MONRR